MNPNSPRVITKSDPTQVAVDWADGHRTVYTAAQLRALCPCANCVDEMTGVRTHDPASVPVELTHTDVKMVGHYAITITFSDGHHTGIYPFPMLRENDPGREVAG
jgi:DUF971 family protein